MSKVTIYLTPSNSAAIVEASLQQQFYGRAIQVDPELAEALVERRRENILINNTLSDWRNRATMKDFDVNTVITDELKEILCLSTPEAPRDEKQQQQGSQVDSNTPSTSSSKKRASKKKASVTKKKPLASTSQSTEDTPVKAAEKQSASSKQADTPQTSS